MTDPIVKYLFIKRVTDLLFRSIKSNFKDSLSEIYYVMLFPCL